MRPVAVLFFALLWTVIPAAQAFTSPARATAILLCALALAWLGVRAIGGAARAEGEAAARKARIAEAKAAFSMRPAQLPANDNAGCGATRGAA